MDNRRFHEARTPGAGTVTRGREDGTRWTAVVAMGALTLSLSLILAVCHAARADASTPFDDIVAGSSSEYDTYQVKLTYTGDQSKTTPSLLLTGLGRSPDVSEFVPYRTPGVHYGNDDDRIIPLVVSGTMIEKIVLGLSERPPLQVPGGVSEPTISIMIERGLPPAEIVFEHLADDIEADQLLNVLIGASLGESDSTQTTIRRFRNFTVGPH